MKNNRLKNSIYNSFSNLLINLTITIFSFIVRTIFIKKLGEQCLGLDGLFTNILSLLSLAELGFSSAINFSLYEPLAKKDYNNLSKLMNFYKNSYKKIGIFILLVGLMLTPFLNVFIKGYEVDIYVYIIYILYLLNTSLSYFTSYTSSLIEADQKNYKLTKIKFIFNFIVYGCQLIVLIIFESYIFYLLSLLIFRQIERIITYFHIKKMYPDVNFKCNEKINDKESFKIKENLKGIIFHKIGEYAVNGTDNILISSIVNITATGIYSNYLSITSVVKNLIGSVINATTASFGNLNVTENSSTKKNVFDLIDFVSFFITGLCVINLYFCLSPFIEFWIGNKYNLNSLCILVICLNFYFNCILLPVNVVKNSSGLYYIDRYIPILQAIINLIFSIVLGLKFGIIGIFLGTTLSYIFTVTWTKPLIIYKKVFNASFLEYLIKLIKNIVILILSGTIAKCIFDIINISNLLLTIFIYIVISSFIFIIIYLVLNFSTKELKYIKEIIFSNFIKRKE